MRREQQLILLFSVLTISFSGWFSSCDIINPDEETPSYIYIDTFILNPGPEEQGYPSHNIVDAWVFVDELPIGTFELPAKIPILNTGLQNITVIPGIKRNGMSGFRLKYPLYEEYSTDVDLLPLETDTLVPGTEYVSNAEFPMLEQFETGNEFTATDNSDTSIITFSSPGDVFEGDRSAAIYLTENNPFAEFRSNRYDLPGNGRPAFLEFDYQSSTPFNIELEGYFGSSGISVYIVTIAPRDEWNKIYIALDDKITILQAQEYEIKINSVLQSGDTDAYIFLDNVKIVYL